MAQSSAEQSSVQSSTQSAAGSVTKASLLTQVGLAAFLGVFLVWGTGFAGNAVLHNAAHDTRHSNGFPCH